MEKPPKGRGASRRKKKKNQKKKRQENTAKPPTLVPEARCDCTPGLLGFRTVLRRISLILVVLALAATSLAFSPGSQNDFGPQLTTGSTIVCAASSVVARRWSGRAAVGGAPSCALDGGTTWRSIGLRVP